MVQNNVYVYDLMRTNKKQKQQQETNKSIKKIIIQK